MKTGEFDTQMMARAIQLAKQGRFGTSPNPRVGCVITRKTSLIAEGWHARAGEGHAEVNALAALAPGEAKGATAYVTLEPCSHRGRTGPCADALVAAGLARVVVAMTDPNPLVAGKGIEKLRSAGIQVDVGVLESQAAALNPGYIRRIQGGQPWVRMKSAMSLDGRTAMASGESYWITGPEARADVQRLRALSCAIVSGVETVLADDPAFTVRPEDFSVEGADPVWRQPIRVILDSQLRTPLKAKLLQGGGPLLILTGASKMDSPAAEALRKCGVEVNEVAQGEEGGLLLSAVMAELARRGCNEVMVEAGATVSGAFLQAGLVDEWFIYMAPSLMGSAGRPLMNWPMETMAQRRELEIVDIRAVGRDWRWQCRLAKKEN
ncbi:bifunctional diaminohydroxyphosphoribosylaminopyrimidine deaminase/5-amino-6-(5-phosphoribosylamino)uracil reductase RibD [Spongiibacter taiwanensis]|uniref:bifunctional diaminohydroxyphosphoribosylaminopyrimidine deaminase/5-amino-6-(5-phosphoribosylamino)uracil reductase RibD n=1 Tax=Spongiibacter taiwanensis TaxID=1748242 RepID=UPI0020363954|nr:bifunctional diaminohydroxyphosphoribosylaminopyrimidine deaminase/5-amino-6-(5-phosphoribosylamino)uracil reductase RibD [Spongiibacter taiwanensis]USA42012.1 bifunctional diaminohydroxyphosphoribosylaminopyrimidine deaminase/5-amino-6-(5-phosphoribosylamino)uracil reductase RibD [Spongiibacter taiwanensis]